MFAKSYFHENLEALVSYDKIHCKLDFEADNKEKIFQHDETNESKY